MVIRSIYLARSQIELLGCDPLGETRKEVEKNPRHTHGMLRIFLHLLTQLQPKGHAIKAQFVTALSIAIFGLLPCVLTSATAIAYVPPSEFIVKTMANKRAHSSAPNKTVRIKATITSTQDDKQGTLTKFQEIALFDLRERMVISRAFDETGKALFEAKRPFNLRDTVIIETNAGIISKALIDNEIPIRTEAELIALENEESRRQAEVSWLGRWKGILTWVIGPKKNIGAPQFWVEKDKFLPLRLITKHQENIMAFSFTDYRFFRELPIPQTTTLARIEADNGAETTVLSIKISDVLINPDHPELTAAIVGGSGGGDGGGFTEAGNMAPAQLKNLIQMYYLF